MPSHLLACLLLIAAEMGIAANVVIGKFLIEYDMPTFMFLGFRFLVSSLCLSLLFLFNPKVISNSHPTSKLEFYDWRFLWAQAFYRRIFI